jgi:hypothetical protein
MDIQDLKPRKGNDTLRIGDSDELVVMENFGSLPQGKLSLDSHGLIVICTEGMAQFDYDGQQIQLHKNDLYLYMAHSVVCNFMSSPDFNCRQIWFSRSELWNINMYGEVSLAAGLQNQEISIHSSQNCTEKEHGVWFPCSFYIISQQSWMHII